jgi:hypothetical protein
MILPPGIRDGSQGASVSPLEQGGPYREIGTPTSLRVEREGVAPIRSRRCGDVSQEILAQLQDNARVCIALKPC